nr:MAG TPA: hypothetical protein [Bacteriophage sp.]
MYLSVILVCACSSSFAGLHSPVYHSVYHSFYMN